MTLYYDLVINCDVADNLPEAALEGMRCLTTRAYKPTVPPELQIPGYGDVWTMFADQHFLAPDPRHEIISNLLYVYRGLRTSEDAGSRLAIYRYSLQYSGRTLHGDYFVQHHLAFLPWLASVAHDAYIGYYRETGEPALPLHHLTIVDGRLHDSVDASSG